MNDVKKIENLIDDYATFADTRNAVSQLSLFTDNAKTVVFYPEKPNEPQVIEGSRALLDGFSGLNQYEKTFHFIGQKNVSIEDDNKASAYVYTIAHHLKNDSKGHKSLMVMYIRYNDILVKKNDSWYFLERDLHIDFIENRTI
ncbi:nuclear transport factor 2 family protein [Liquorilactobacillus mali]|uniref:SnoaL-like domain-containing protein n=1 Tax=Liquorilactobacillus mali KCTC 3596 = DSM 20444 TaxID=1046596 RepID=J1F2I9_9LACO|nr:nuclear transport factor 2 family protein [Liquorilactobacillus mali]EJE99149.1 hypothetical protein LMA_06241 [Liquorilactobacillus mali KCTC 3596 = DSM 20444]KRN04895.1 hypothetical protein FD00_GL000379 [Liquorilactobacillus mali KCTC 3596 = DSM 20444]MDC7952799.1 nuclear transport factor 2 family protein [Liquorilactobacillus mali]QFQ75414.1 nuclear transport factor 2 family protein [Liquorilactobacillus mali]